MLRLGGWVNLLLKLFSSPLSLLHSLRQQLHQQLTCPDHDDDADDADDAGDDDDDDDHDDDVAQLNPDDDHLLSPWLSTRLASKSFL